MLPGAALALAVARLLGDASWRDPASSSQKERGFVATINSQPLVAVGGRERPCEVYWGTREPARDSRGPTSRRVAPGSGPYLRVCSCKFGQMPVLYVFGSRLSGWSQPSLACQVAMPWTRPEGEGRRAGRSPESRCSGTPFNAQSCDIQEEKVP